MFSYLLFFHSAVRWLVLLTLIYTIFNSLIKYKRNAVFTKLDNKLRHWTATTAHIQLMLGMVLYFKSPAVAQYRAVGQAAGQRIGEPLFFSWIHISMMILSILIITFGSAVSKRQETDQQKFKVIWLYFGLALLIILAAIPWPFSPLAQRPFLRRY